MMKAQITISLLVSLLLVGGATFMKFNQSSETQNTISVEKNMDEYIASFQSASLEDMNADKEDLTQTDLIGRQLFSEYIDIVSRGQATSQNLNVLANSYADNILEAHAAPSITIAEVTVVVESAESLSAYSAQIFSTRTKYEGIMTALYKKSGFANAADPRFKQFMKEVGENYKKAAEEIRLVAVPTSLANNHVGLVNNYLSSSAAATSLSNVDVDPVIAYAALNTQAKNTAEEAQLLSQINLRLLQSGLPSGDI